MKTRRERSILLRVPYILTYLIVSMFASTCSYPLPKLIPENMRTASSATQLPTTEPLIFNTIQEVLDKETQARQSSNPTVLQALFDPSADSAWLEKQYRLSYPGIMSIEAKRIEMVDDLALAAVVITQVGPTQTNPASKRIYTYRTLHRLGTRDWKLTSPAPAPWGQQETVELSCLRLTYYTFDTPYVQAIVQKHNSVFSQMAEDFHIPLCNEEPLILHIVPTSSPPNELPFWKQTAGNKIVSPLAQEFSLELAGTPSQFLLGLLTDSVGHMLLQRAYGERTTEVSRIQLSHPIVQWEVEEATEYSARSRLLEQLSQSQEQLPLSVLLDPTREITPGKQPSMRELFAYFLVDTYGRTAIAPFLKAVFTANSAEELTAIAFEKPLLEVDEQWRQWLSR